MISVARYLIVIGLVFLAIGGLLYLAARAGIHLGRLPGDIRIQNQNFSCVFALGTSILLSIVLTLILNLIVRLLNK
jgi:hypothetical protein